VKLILKCLYGYIYAEVITFLYQKRLTKHFPIALNNLQFSSSHGGFWSCSVDVVDLLHKENDLPRDVSFVPEGEFSPSNY
jgi:hypothetical protein